MSTSDYEIWFRAACGHPPHPWQRELGRATSPSHRMIRIPTGYGKTIGVATTWLYHAVVRARAEWPRRLVWMLPMRTLVEQTEAECKKLLQSLNLYWEDEGDHDGKVGLHVLMGGSDVGRFHLYPEAPAMFIGTQDMLLSRALNRGYGTARGRWPVDFGLLSQDCLWVLDEVQLMGVGFATALQLATFRDDHVARRPTYTWSMSATLQRSWISKSPDTAGLEDAMLTTSLSPEDEALPLWTSSSKPIERVESATPAVLAAKLLEARRGLQDPSTTLAVFNTVERARTFYNDLVRRVGPKVAVHLLHSRFRGAERKNWVDLLRREGAARILVATQVVEAGVDLSADLLMTEICPWPSLVQRLGRLARRGGKGRAIVAGLELPKEAPPYDEDALDAAWSALAHVTDGSPRSLEVFERAHPELIEELYPYDPPHFVQREDMAELFDTTPDLSGGDIDVSRFIREGDERDLSVAWIELPDEKGVKPTSSTRVSRDALCAVPFLTARDWLCGKASGSQEPARLKPGIRAFVWDYLDGEWRACQPRDLRPGASVLVDAANGGYDLSQGFDPRSSATVPVLPLVEADAQERTDAAQDQEDLSWTQWQTIGFHGRVVADVARRIAQAVGELDDLVPLLGLAARWHDLGKAHPAFQGAIAHDERPQRSDLAKAPKSAWIRKRCIYRFGEPPELRPGLRHELASVLALFDLLLEWAPPDHPARLGALASMIEPEPPRKRPEDVPGPLEAEVLVLSADEFDLVAYLVCAHHGKVRARLDASPADQDAPGRPGRPRGERPIRGIYEGDRLPPVALADADGELRELPSRSLSLEPAALGLSARTGRSWTERVDTLRGRLGPYALAYLEAILRAADVRASMNEALRDPNITEVHR